MSSLLRTSNSNVTIHRMITIRLSRDGKRNAPFYHVVASEKRSRRDSSNLEVLGSWHPRKKDISLDKKKIEAWIAKGAQISPAVKKLLATK